ncbi:competence type IV pilus minor pilin ComGF [Cytobacillus sp.]|uniref:competence type IV pilus minor pilin ComGF n=1 Tax=Cytobacillus sp. TaxID=2675269 RepID=UPI0028BEA50D|nr:competence type IV pilus minor pilin ComGF [Cytobacillus sp.]
MKIFFSNPMKRVKLFNHKGFTMVEMLYAFSIFLIIVSFFPLSFKYLFQNEQFEARNKAMEWHVFVQQLKKEVRLSDEIIVFNDRLILRRDGQSIQFDKHGTNIRRRVDEKGHEIVFQQVERIRFDKLKNGVRLTVNDLFHQQHTASFITFLDLEEDYDP